MNQWRLAMIITLNKFNQIHKTNKELNTNIWPVSENGLNITQQETNALENRNKKEKD